MAPSSSSELFSMAPTSSPSMTTSSTSMATSSPSMATSSPSTSERFSQEPSDSSEPDDSDLDNDSSQRSVSSGSRGIPSMIGIFIVIVSLVFVG